VSGKHGSGRHVTAGPDVAQVGAVIVGEQRETIIELDVVEGVVLGVALDVMLILGVVLISEL
jgi:hypothetical protein